MSDCTIFKVDEQELELEQLLDEQELENDLMPGGDNLL